LSSQRLNLEIKFLSLITKLQTMKSLDEEPLTGGPGFSNLTALLLPSIDLSIPDSLKLRILLLVSETI